MEGSELEIKNIEDKVAANTGNIATNAADIATYHPGTVALSILVIGRFFQILCLSQNVQTLRTHIDI